jgi:hypothetical protein
MTVGKPTRLLHGPGFVHAVGNARARRAQTDLGHGVLELQAVFGLVDGLGRGADQLDLVLVEHAVAPQVQRAVQRGLAAHGGQDGVGALLGDDLLDRLPGDGLDVGDVGRGRVGHDRGGVAVDQDDLVTLLAQRLAGLHAGVVELAGLADDDRAGADDEDALDVCALGHCSSFFAGLAPSVARREAVEQVAMSCGPGEASGCPWKQNAGLSVRGQALQRVVVEQARTECGWRAGWRAAFFRPPRSRGSGW